jgi:hypothetical protein
MADGSENGGYWSCCNDTQTLFILLYIAFVALVLITWKTLLAKPMRLMAVFLHEYSHATACWLTGGDVKQLEVYDNEGGVTRYRGGCRCLIIPAGYVGCAMFAMVFVILSGGRRTATAAAIGFTIALLISLCYSPNRTMVYLNLAYAIVTIGLLVVEWKVYTPILQFAVLFLGVFTGIFAIADIYSDTIVRSVQGSDAYACYLEVCPCCLPRCVGLQWAMLAIVCQLFGIWIALVEMSDDCYNKGWLECLHLEVAWDEWDFDLDFLDFRDWDIKFFHNHH